MAEPKIYVALGYHVNYYHSWRGDRNDDTGFGMDTRIIRELIAIMDRANERGQKCGGTWDFDNYWTLECIMPLYAADVLDAMKRRVHDGLDEVIVDAWNNGFMSAATIEEFRENLKRTISNPAGSGIKDIFGKFTPLVRPQETMWTQGQNELYLEQGIKALSLYYSCVPFDAFRNFVPKLGPNEMYNPLWLKSTESNARMILIPTYSHGDVADHFSLMHWLKQIHNFQLEGRIKGDALIYINMDADADLWIGLGLPKFLNWVPNTRGIEEYTEVLNQCPYAEYGTLGEYIAAHEPVAEIELRQDMADGSFTGCNSWTEKEVNHRLWRLSERARWFKAVAEHITGSGPAPAEVKAKINKLLYSDPDSWFENKLRLLSTTHFGMNSPAINEERAQVGFHFAVGACEKAADSAQAAIKILKSQTAGRENDLLWFRIFNQPKYKEKERIEAGVRVPIRFPLPRPLAAHAEKLTLQTADGLDAPFDILNAETDGDGNLKAGELVILHTTDNKPFTDYIIRSAKTGKAGAVVKASELGLASDSVQVELDGDGRISELKVGGEQFASDSFLSLALTYKANGRKTTFKSDRFEVLSYGVGPKGKYGWLRLRAEAAFIHKGREYKAVGDYELGLMAKLPYLFLEADVRFPETPREHGDLSIQSRLKEKFDANWFEVMPAMLGPDIQNAPGRHLRVWKHNYLDVTNYYDLNYGAFDPRNRNMDSFNNHVTDGWVAVSSHKKGLLISCNALVNSSPAFCPMRVREKAGTQSIWLNPFGSFHGKQFSHLPEGSGLAGRITVVVGAQHRPTAPSFNGRRVRVSMMIAPYSGDGPREALRREADAFSLPPAVAFKDDSGAFKLHVPAMMQSELVDAVEAYNLDSCRGWTYMDFLNDRNKGEAAGEPSKGKLPSLPLHFIVRAFIDSLRGLF